MKKTIVVFGGAFSPVTYAHLSLAEQLTNEYDVEKILFMPVNDLYNKKDLLPSHHRLFMLQTVAINNPKFEVSNIEINSKKVLNTIDTLNIVQKQYPEYQIAFVMGTDNLIQIDTWDNYEELLTNFKVFVISRDGASVNSIVNAYNTIGIYKDNIIEVSDNVRNDNSSTIVRNLLKQNKSIRYLVPDEVYLYIKKYGLFKDM